MNNNKGAFDMHDNQNFNQSQVTENGLIEDQIVFLTLPTLNLIYQQNNPTDLLGLYTFYYKTAKHQKTNQPWATQKFTMNALNWGRQRLEKAQEKLIELRLIDKISRRDQKGDITMINCKTLKRRNYHGR